jgi:hypothetical protein
VTLETLLDALAVAGLWKDLDDDQSAIVEQLAAGETVTWERGGAWQADGEDLAEGEVEDLLMTMAAPLRQCGVVLEVETVVGPNEADADRYEIAINGESHVLYEFDPEEPGTPTSEDPWMDCTIEPAAAVNALLADAGSDRRLAAFWPGGNDGFVVLGPEDVLTAVAEQGDDNGEWDCEIP